MMQNTPANTPWQVATALFLGLGLTLTGAISPVLAKEVQVTITVKEVDLAVDNKGTTQPMWTFGGTVPGPLVRVTEGDVVDFTLVNDQANKQSHSMDFHAARVDVLDEFEAVKPGHAKHFKFTADYPGIFIYHCGADAMVEHIARGMYGAIIVDPKDGYSAAYPKPDREYVIVQGDLFAEGTTAEEMLESKNWVGALINGRIFHYDPVHDDHASLTMQSKPGERVRLYFVNANVHEPVAFHPIAGIWERVYDSGNPQNVSYGIQTHTVAPASAATFDLISPADRPTNNALVDHAMKRALKGAITVLMNFEEADPALGRGDNLLLRSPEATTASREPQRVQPHGRLGRDAARETTAVRSTSPQSSVRVRNIEVERIEKKAGAPAF